MNYNDTLQYLYQQMPMFQRIGRAAFKHDLTNTLQLMKHLGQPQNDFKSIHIAGTNGKGSTAHMIAAILQACGFKVGLYTSPHYREFRERIKINGIYISEKYIIDFVAKHRNYIDTLKPSFFELTVGMAFDYFKHEGVDVAVVETGLGGRLDSTNIVRPLVSVITNIGYDHMKILGDTLPKIAGEKAGIIKNNVPVIIGETHHETESVFQNKALEQNASITFADQILEADLVSMDFIKSIYSINDTLGNTLFNQLELGLYGNYQAKNLITSIATIQRLQNDGHFQISEMAIRQGLKNIKTITNFIGRWEILGHQPMILADSGHNESGIQEVMLQLEKMRFERLHMVIGVVKDKDLDKILPMFPKQALYYFTQLKIPRGMDVEQLKGIGQQHQLFGAAYSSVQAALNAAKINAKSKDLIFIGGSTFTVAEVI